MSHAVIILGNKYSFQNTATLPVLLSITFLFILKKNRHLLIKKGSNMNVGYKISTKQLTVVASILEKLTSLSILLFEK